MAEIFSRENISDVKYLYSRFGRKLYGYAVSKWNIDEDNAWELVYKTLYKVKEVIPKYTFESEEKFSGFIFKIFINYLRNHYRDNKNNPQTVELNESHGKVMENEGEKKSSNANMDCLKKALAQLLDWQRILLLMRAQDFSYEQIAKYVEKPLDQLKVYHMRLKKQVTDSTNDCMGSKI